ncbi:MAG: pyrrolo-quinoline quinone [Verrucomicrobia bacterium]|nr:pyrrolo-quinoline quinone [Verrucomicrobiota bacterium]
MKHHRSFLNPLRAALLGALAASTLAVADDWPQWLGPQRDGVWRETGIVEKFPSGGPPVRWRTPIGGGFTGPAVASGRVYLMDRQLPEGTRNPSNPFDRGSIPGRERVLCLNEADGRVLWQHSYDCPYTVSYATGPRATPLVAGGKVYTLSAEGHLFCFEADTGKVVWSRDFKQDFGAKTPVWGFAGHPLLDGPRLICLVGGDGAVAVALDKETGQEQWRALTAKEPGYCPPTLITHAGRRQVILWHPESVNALEPESGKVLWSVPFESRAGLSVSTPRLAGDGLFITTFYNGSLLLRLGAGTPEVVYRSQKASEKDTTELHSIIPTPFIEGGHVYGVCSYGQLRCLKLDTGERVWETLAATTPEKETRWGNAFLVKHQDRFFLFNERGDLIIAKLTPLGYQELSRAHLLDPTNPDPGRRVVWSHPAFANRSVYARNDVELVCVSLAAAEPAPAD